MNRSVTSRVEVAVDARTAFRAFTEEMDLWWVRGPVNFYDAARAIARVCETGVGGRLLEVYEDDALEVARIIAWEPGVRVAWDSALDDVRTEVTFTAAKGGGTLVEVTATIPDGGLDCGGTAYVRVVPPWFGAWCARRDFAPRVAAETARLAVAVSYPKPATAARWLADAFGLAPTNPLPESDEAPGWIEFHVGNCSLMVFALSDGDAGVSGVPGVPGVSGVPGVPGVPGGATLVPWVFVDDLDAHHAHAVSRGAEIVEDIAQHGYRAYVARDPDGYTWTIAQARPGMR